LGAANNRLPCTMVALLLLLLVVLALVVAQVVVVMMLMLLGWEQQCVLLLLLLLLLVVVVMVVVLSKGMWCKGGVAVVHAGCPASWHQWRSCCVLFLGALRREFAGRRLRALRREVTGLGLGLPGRRSRLRLSFRAVGRQGWRVWHYVAMLRTSSGVVTRLGMLRRGL